MGELLALVVVHRRPSDLVVIYPSRCNDTVDHMKWPDHCHRTGLTIRGPYTNVRRGPFSHTPSQDFLCGCFSGVLFFPKKLTFISHRYV